MIDLDYNFMYKFKASFPARFIFFLNRYYVTRIRNFRKQKPCPFLIFLEKQFRKQVSNIV